MSNLATKWLLACLFAKGREKVQSIFANVTKYVCDEKTDVQPPFGLTKEWQAVLLRPLYGAERLVQNVSWLSDHFFEPKT